MKRREFITLLGGAAATWPLAARGQQATGVRRVAFLHPYVENDPEVLARVIAFREGLEALGWTENRNIRIEHRYSGGDLGRIRAYAQELVRFAPDLIVGSGTPITAALKQATAPSRLYSMSSTIRSDKVWWPACRSQAATSPASLSSTSH
jgi:putative ABC transport system substrate-binding protein